MSAEGEDVGTSNNAEGEDVGTGNNTGTNDVYVPADTDFLIYKAAFDNGWEFVRELFERRPELKTKSVNKRLETPLMIAVKNSSHEFVKQLLNNVENRHLDHDEWCGVDNDGNNALHYAARVGNVIDAKLMRLVLPETMTRIRNIDGHIPASLAAKLGWEDMISEVFYEYAETDVQIFKAALGDKWDDVCVLFRDSSQRKTKPVNDRLETPLMVAVGTNSSHDFVEKLLNNVETHDRDKWCGVNIHGDNALHYAAKAGNMIDAKLIMDCFQTLKEAKNTDGDIPAILAAKQGRGDMFDDVFSDYKNDPYLDDAVNLIIPAIQTGLLDLALTIVYLIIKAEEDLITSNALTALRNYDLQALVANALEALATKPEFFPSGNRLGFCAGLFYRSIKNIQDIKIKNVKSHAIVKKLCQMMTHIMINKKDPRVARNMVESAIAKAVKYGIYELIEECIVAYPHIIWYNYGGYNLFHLAIKERQVQVYNLVYQMSGYKEFLRSILHGNENALHIAAKLAPSHQPSTITGAALLLQRELQWYKEVETFVEAKHVNALSGDGKTPWMVFMDEHRELLKEGQQWMKEAATSCTLVASLIVTITFAAAITAPGGNKDDGKPVFLNERAFLLFMMSDAFALFSSSTSLLMFLGILTSGYAEIDFLYALPKRLMIGLMFLFLSIAATMIAFGATLALLLHDKVTWIELLLHDKVSWIAVPVVMITSIPVGLCGSLQFRLLVELVWSTYGPRIFRKQSSRVIY